MILSNYKGLPLKNPLSKAIGTVSPKTQYDTSGSDALKKAYDQAQAGVTAAEKEQGKNIESQYGELRRALSARELEAQRQSDLELARASNASQGFGGAEAKMKQEATQRLQEGFGAQEAGLGAQKAQAKQQLASEAAQRRYATAERLGTQAQQQQQFEKTFGLSQDQFAFAKDSFNREFAENLKTNIINAAVAAKNAGLDTIDFWQAWGPTSRQIYGPSRTPILSPEDIQAIIKAKE